GSTQTITTNGASELVVIPRTEYDRLITELEDAKDITAAKEFEAREAIGDAEFLPWEMAKRLRCGEHPIAVWRDHRRFTQKALAEQVKMTAAQLSEIENGKKTGSVATLQKLAQALGVTVDELLPQMV
ncbi:MAG: helix-turn-helix transcriptional regulator, partial [Chakrabartia sp.]